jgi:SAM-dependent methyltransferase
VPTLSRNYSVYAKYYDELNTDYYLWHSVIRGNLDGNNQTGRMIEFGCGTGNILKEYAKSYDVFGVDASEEMIERAAEKIPNGHFYLDDMVTFSASETFDVALCLFDSINHILDIDRWRQFFENVASMLSPNGVFIVDANTTARLSKIVGFPPLFKEFDANCMSMKLVQSSETNFVFDVRIFFAGRRAPLSGRGRTHRRDHEIRS